MKSKIIFLSWILLSATGISTAQEIDPILRFYLSKTDSILKDSYIFNTDVTFSLKATSISQKTDYRGKLEEVDTVSFRLYYSNGVRDSININDSAFIEENILIDDFNFPIPDANDNKMYFFPNDTGSGPLAIGFESNDSTLEKFHSGLLNIDRSTYLPITFMFHNLRSPQFYRLSENYCFGSLEKYIILSSYEKHGVKKVFLGRKYMHQIILFSDYEIK